MLKGEHFPGFPIMPTSTTGLDFATTRLGVIMRPRADQPHEAWGVVNPGGVRAGDGTVHLFPRLIAEGNYSRIGHARVCFDGATPVDVERLGVALEPHESYEVSSGGGGVEDPRVVYVPLLEPETEYERSGLVANVVFPSATDLRADGALDVYYGAADHVIAAVRIDLPSSIPAVRKNAHGR